MMTDFGGGEYRCLHVTLSSLSHLLSHQDAFKFLIPKRVSTSQPVQLNNGQLWEVHTLYPY